MGPLDIIMKQPWLWAAVYHMIGRDDVAPCYAAPMEAPYTGQIYQPTDPPEAAENTDSFEEEPPLLEGKERCYDEMFLRIIYFKG